MDSRQGRTFVLTPGRTMVSRRLSLPASPANDRDIRLMNQTYKIDNSGPAMDLLTSQGTVLNRTMPIATSTPTPNNVKTPKINSLSSDDMGNFMYNMWKKQKMCDMFIKADGVVFKLHKIVLAASSDTFSQTFADTKCTCRSSPEIELHGVSTDVVQILLNYLYTSDIPIDITTVSEFIHAAKQLGLSSLLHLCKSFLLRVSINNILLHRNIAESCDLIDVLGTLHEFIRQRFLDIVVTNEFKSLPIEAIVHLFTDENLNVNNELEIFSAALSWIDFNRQERLKYAERLMALVRFEHIPPHDIATTVETAKHIFQIPNCKALLYNAFKYQSLKYSESTLVDSMDVPKSRGPNISTNYDPRLSIMMSSTPKRTSPRFSKNESSRITRGPDVGQVHIPDTPNFENVSGNANSFSPIRARQSLLLVSGGVNPYNTEADVPGRAIEQYNPRTNCWYHMTKMPDSRHHHGAVVLDNYFFVIGGSVMSLDEPEDLANPTEICYKYDPIRGVWSTMAPMLSKRMYHAVTTFNGSIVALGGQDDQGQILDTVESYEHISDVWKSLPRMIERKIGPTAIEFKGRLLVVGGFAESPKHQVALSTVECYDPATNCWTRNNPLPIPCCHANVVMANDRLFLIGGSTLCNIDEPVTSLPSVLRYIDGNDTWEIITELRVPRHDAGAAVIGSKIYVVGGANSFQKRTLTDMECFDVEKNAWIQPVDGLKSPCLGMACCALPGNMVL